jgi:choline dehydrogenase-like flavoprotein
MGRTADRWAGGSSAASAVNACMVLGLPADYDEWATAGRSRTTPHLDRAIATLAPPVTDTPTPPGRVLESAEAARLPFLADPSDPGSPVGVAPSPRNVAEGLRWNTAFAYLDEARGRPSLTIVADTLVDRVELDDSRATGVVCADGQRIEAETVILAAGAYFSPAILLRSGLGPEAELRGLGITVVEDLPVGQRLLDHCGTDVAWKLTEAGQKDGRGRASERPLQAHVVIVGRPATGSWTPPALDLPAEGGGYHAARSSSGAALLRAD